MENIKLAWTVVAASALTRGQAVAFDGTVAAAGDNCLGFAAMDAAAGEAVAANVSGVIVAKAGALIAQGDALEVGAGGTLVTANTGTVVAYALEAGEPGKTVTVLVK